MDHCWRVQHMSTTAHSKGLLAWWCDPAHGMSRDSPKLSPHCLATAFLGVLLLHLISETGSTDAPAVIGGLGEQTHKEGDAPPSLSQWLRSALEEKWARLRPVRDWRTPVRVTVGFTVQSVLGMNEKQERLLLYVFYRQVWRDERFSWDPVLHHGVQRVTVPAGSIWVPDVVIYERVGQEEEPRRPTQVSITHQGWVEQLEPRLLESRCPLNLFHFPLDCHTCNLTFVLQSHTSADEVKVYWDSGSERGGREWEGPFSRGEWEVLSITASSTLQPLPDLLHTSAVRVQVTVQRRPLLYLVTLLLPSSLLLLLDALGFFIPVHLKQRISMKGSIFTGHFIFIISIFTLFPPFTRDMPLIEVYLFGSLGLLACSTMETVLVFQVVSGRSEWVRRLAFPCLSGIWGRCWWEEPQMTDQSQNVTGVGDGCPEGEQQGGMLGALWRDLAQVRGDLRRQREEQEWLSACSELGSTLDRAYLYLHCLVLLAGGVILHMQWH